MEYYKQNIKIKSQNNYGNRWLYFVWWDCIDKKGNFAEFNYYITNFGHCLNDKQVKMENNSTQHILKNNAVCANTCPLEIIGILRSVNS